MIAKLIAIDRLGQTWHGVQTQDDKQGPRRRLVVTGILKNTDKMTRDISQATPEMRQTLVELQGTLAQARGTLAAFEGVAAKADNLLGSEGNSLAAQLRQTLASAQRSMDQLNTTMEHAQPVLDQVSAQTLPAAEATIRDLRATSRALRNVTEKIDEQGAGALLKGRAAFAARPGPGGQPCRGRLRQPGPEAAGRVVPSDPGRDRTRGGRGRRAAG